MKNNQQILFRFTAPLLCLVFLTTISCNELKYGTAAKKNIQLSSQTEKGLALQARFNPSPDVMGVFLWPSEEYFERGREMGWFDGLYEGQDYISYIERVSYDVLLADDNFSRWTLLYFERSGEIAEELSEITDKKDAIRSQVRELNQENKSLREQRKTLRDALENAPESAKSSYENELIAIDQRISDIFQEKKGPMQKLKLLSEQEDALKEGVEEALAHQQEASRVTQHALDPHAVSFVLDENGQKILDKYGFPVRTIDEEAQVNWIKIYEEGIEQDNYFNISNEEKIDIRLGSWAGRVYETKYQKNARGEWELLPSSTIYDVSFSSEKVLKFKLREKDHRENETGRIFELELELSRFGSNFRFTGDILVTVGGNIVRRGQLEAHFRKN